jgi:hypothetical protein
LLNLRRPINACSASRSSFIARRAGRSEFPAELSIHEVAHEPLTDRTSGNTLRLALLLAFPAIGLEQLLHTGSAALAAMPLYQALHWLSDSLLALPLAAGAVWSGQRLATRLRLGASTPLDVVARACLITLLFALMLVPGAALHDLADRLTHVHVGLATHSHIPRPPRSDGGVAVLARFVAHALSDGVVGQAVGLPLTILALLWQVRTSRLRGVVTPKRMEEA